MRKIFTFTKREYKASVKTKGFIIGLILAPIFMAGGLIAFAIFKDRVDTTDKKVAIVDRSGVIASALVKAAETRNATEIYNKETGKKIKPAYLFEVVEPNEENPEAQRLQLSNRIQKGELHAFVEIGSGVVHPEKNNKSSRIAYHAKNAVMDDLRGWIAWPINNQLRRLRLADAGIEESAVKDLFYWINAEALGLVSVDADTGKVKGARRASEGEAIGVPIAMMMLMYLMILMGVSPLLHSVMEEKTQRIAEVLLGSVKPSEFMAGKVLGGVGVSLTSSAVYVIGGIIAVKRMGLEEYIPYHILPWFFIYMLLAIIMLGAMNTALGASCSEAKDAQSLMFPTMLPVIIPMFLLMPVLREPHGNFATWLSMFPAFTPMLMLLRQTTPAGVPMWQPYVGLTGMVLFTLISVWAGGRIFRVGILMQGQSPKFSNIIRWAIRG